LIDIAPRRPLMNRVAFVFFLILSAVPPTSAQSVADLSAKYPVVQAFEVRPGILMTARYDADGQVCEMVLERRHTTKTGIDLGVSLTQEEVIKLVEELVPEVDRGKKLKGFYKSDSSITVNGSIVETEYPYENISIVFHGSVSDSCAGDMVAIVKWRKRACNHGGLPAATALKPQSGSANSNASSTAKK
jgi:hypothetical protein